jgi:cation-transporting ATPase E
MTRNGYNETYLLGAYDVLAQRCCTNMQPPADFIEAQGLDVYRNLLFGIATAGEESSVEPLAVVSLSDTVRTDVRAVLERFSRFGIAFKILSGDSAQSIRATCRDIGWDLPPDGVITGVELESLDEPEFARAVERSTVFARLKPEHKVKIVGALRARGIHTAMIGDGVNDVPAIKQADLGIAMEEGAAITREVADVVLRENRFTLLPQVYEEGNRIVNTVGAVAKLFLTKNLLVIYLTLAAALLMLEFPLTPRRVSLFNVFAIGVPAMVIAFMNANSARVRRFFIELLSYVAISALVIVAFAYGGLSAASGEPAPMVMVSILVVISVANFLVVAWGTGHAGMARYAGLAAAMLVVYGVGTSLTGDGWILRLIRGYYEISPLDVGAWKVVAGYGLAGSTVLAGLQWWRARLLGRGQ